MIYWPLLFWVLLNRAHTSIHLNLALCSTLNNISTKILHVIGQFPQILAQKLSVLSENWRTQYLNDADSESRLRFLKFWPKTHFWANLSPKSQRCSFCLKIGKHGISSMLTLISTSVFWISNPNFLFGQIWAEKVKVVLFPENWHAWHLDDVNIYSNSSFLNLRP